MTLDEAYEYVVQSEEHRKFNAWRLFDPYPKQKEFMNLGAAYPERLLTAGNQTGKSHTGAYEVSRHLTGVYPDWWEGVRFDQNTGPCDTWVGGTSGVAVRDGPQKKLFGEPGVAELFGTGFIPKDTILGDPTSSRSATSAYDTAHIRHISGAVCSLGFKTYSQDRKDWQGPTKKFIWFDEEPPIEIYSEGLARLAATGGSHILTFTPLLGYSTVVKRFLECEPQYQHRRVSVQMALTDSLHMTPELIEATLSSYQRHEWAARRDGDPHLAGGLIFSSDPMSLIEEPFDLTGLLPPPIGMPVGWRFLWGVDFTHAGGLSSTSHPFAAVLMAFEPEFDITHVLATVRLAGTVPLMHADAMKRIASNVPVAWPHDGNNSAGLNTEVSGTETIAALYRSLGLNMLGEHATHIDGGFQVDPALIGMDQAMRSARFRVGANCTDWLQEYRLYHRDAKGKIVKVGDDLMSATRIGWMARRFARAVPLGSKAIKRRPHLMAQNINPFTGRTI